MLVEREREDGEHAQKESGECFDRQGGHCLSRCESREKKTEKREKAKEMEDVRVRVHACVVRRMRVCCVCLPSTA